MTKQIWISFFWKEKTFWMKKWMKEWMNIIKEKVYRKKVEGMKEGTHKRRQVGKKIQDENEEIK